MTTRTNIATLGEVSTTPRGEVRIHGTGILKRDVYLTPSKARALACALLCEANNAEKEQAKRRFFETHLAHIPVFPGESGAIYQIMPSTWNKETE